MLNNGNQIHINMVEMLLQKICVLDQDLAMRMDPSSL
jgi:hypothetical protein